MSAEVRHILVPVDGSESARRALERALWLARVAGADLTVLEVIEEGGPLPSYYEQPPPGETREHWLSRERLEPVRDLLEHTDVAWRLRVEEGTPADVICALAEEEGYDLIVMGKRGLSAVGRWLVGSVSDRVLRHAPGSVMVVK